jgi:50S ribosomal protein L16 3-hydroxylase
LSDAAGWSSRTAREKGARLDSHDMLSTPNMTNSGQLDTRTFFETYLPALLRSSPETMKSRTSFRFDITGEGGGTWTLDLASLPPRCVPGAPTPVECAIEIGSADFESFLKDQSVLDSLFYEGKVKLDGDMEKVADLEKIFAALGGEPPPAGLAQLVAPFPVDRFLKEIWPNELLLIEGAPSRLQGLADLPELADVHALLSVWRGPVRVFPPGKQDYVSPFVPAEAAGELYERGFTLVFDSVHRWVPALQPYLEAVTRDLGLPPGVWARTMAYASMSGGGFNPHFDENVNFSIQLKGKKHWRLAPNQHVTHPTASHLMSLPVPHPDLTVQAQLPFPRQLPEDAQALMMEPGSVLFIPRGYWHATSVSEHSLSFNFTFDQPCWADLVSEGIRRRLLEHPHWRELAQGAGVEDPAMAAAAQQRLGERLGQLMGDLGALDVSAILAALPLRRRGEQSEPLDLKRDWVNTLSQLGDRSRRPRPEEEP